MKNILLTIVAALAFGTAHANDKTCLVQDSNNLASFYELNTALVLNPGHGNTTTIDVRSCAEGIGRLSKLVIRGEKRAFNNWSPAWVDSVVVTFGNGNSRTLLEGSSYLSTYDGGGAIGRMKLKLKKARCIRSITIHGHSASGGQSMISVWGK